MEYISIQTNIQNSPSSPQSAKCVYNLVGLSDRAQRRRGGRGNTATVSERATGWLYTTREGLHTVKQRGTAHTVAVHWGQRTKKGGSITWDQLKKTKANWGEGRRNRVDSDVSLRTMPSVFRQAKGGMLQTNKGQKPKGGHKRRSQRGSQRDKLVTKSKKWSGINCILSFNHNVVAQHSTNTVTKMDSNSKHLGITSILQINLALEHRCRLGGVAVIPIVTFSEPSIEPFTLSDCASLGCFVVAVVPLLLLVRSLVPSVN